jgi:hypothetical protein
MTTVLLPKTQTYATMLERLRVRCKLHATIGDSPALKDILTEANEYVFRKLDDNIRLQSTLTLAPNTRTYDFTSDEGVTIARGSVHSVWIKQGSTDRLPLPQGITHAHRSLSTEASLPERWDTLTSDGDFKIELWPVPDKRYVLYIDHNMVLTRFSESTDKPSCSPQLVLAYAIAMGKAHYGQADATSALQSFMTILADEQYKQHENRRYLPPNMSVGHGTTLSVLPDGRHQLSGAR